MNLERQGGIVPVELMVMPVVVVGCGTTGSWCAHALLRMGFGDVKVVDPDVVESHNAPAQFHARADGERKVKAFCDAMEVLGLPRPGAIVKRKFAGKMVPEGSVVFSCVDSVLVRKQVGRAARRAKARRLVDFRMGHEDGSVVFAGEKGPVGWKRYMKTLDREFVEEEACGKRAVLTTGLALVSVGLGHWIAGERNGGDLAERLEVDLARGEVREVKA